MPQEIVPLPLPWKRPYKGLMIAELGATFRVERMDDGWRCTVQRGKERMVVLAKGLTRQRDGQCRAEAYAATLSEVRAAHDAAVVGTEGPHPEASARGVSVAPPQM